MSNFRFSRRAHSEMAARGRLVRIRSKAPMWPSAVHFRSNGHARPARLVRFVPECDIADLVPYNRGRRLRRPHFLRRRRVGHPFYVIVMGADRDDRMWWFVFMISIASIPLAGKTVRERARSFRIWLWIAAFVGPLAPLVLLILGDAEHPARAN